MSKLEKIIDKLSKEAGYPVQKLPFEIYYNILIKAHKIMYQS